MTPAPEADDFFKKVTKDPWFRLGMAMLEQGGPQDRPHSVGQDIARAVEKVQGQMDNDVARSQAREQMARENQMREFMQNQLQGLSGGQMPLAGAFAGPQMPAEARPAPQAAFMPPTVAPRIDPVANPSSDIRITRQPTGRLRSSAIDEQITRAAKAAGVDPLLFRSLVQSESNFNHMDPRKGGITTSYAGALGAAQLMPGTAGELGVDPMDLEQNLAGGARYLAQQIKANGGDVREALRAYNAGPTGARRNPRLGGDYADTIMGRLPGPINAAAPEVAPAPMPMAPPQSGATQLPPELHRIFLAQAYAEGGGDPTATVRSYYRQLSQWQTQQFTQGGNLSNQRQLEDYKFRNDRLKQDDEQAFRVKQAEDEANRKPQIAYDEARAKDDAEKFGRLESSITQTEDGLFSVAQMKSLLQAGVMTGGASEQLNEFAKLAKSLTGADIDTGRADFIQSLGGQFLKALRAQQAANGTKDPNPSNADLLFDQKIIPSMQNSPEGNMLILLQMQRTFQRNRELAEAAVTFAEREGRFDSLKFRKSPEAQAVYQRYRLKPDDPQRLQKSARALMQGAQEIENEEQYNALPSGSVFISPDGQVRRKR